MHCGILSGHGCYSVHWDHWVTNIRHPAYEFEGLGNDCELS